MSADIHNAGANDGAPFLPLGADICVRRGAWLPHWASGNGTYAVTFRLGDSLPQTVLRSWEDERNDIRDTVRRQGRKPTPSEVRRMEKLRSAKIQAYLDAGRGACHFRDASIAECLAETLRRFDGSRYSLYAWVIMPNHVHVIVGPMPPRTLPEILHSWKSYTAKFANKRLGRSGTFWQAEYYDHLIRNAEEFSHGVLYIRENPAKAGLRDWPWVWVRGEEKT